MGPPPAVPHVSEATSSLGGGVSFSPEKLKGSNFRATALLAQKTVTNKSLYWSSETHLSLLPCLLRPRDATAETTALRPTLPESRSPKSWGSRELPPRAPPPPPPRFSSFSQPDLSPTPPASSLPTQSLRRRPQKSWCQPQTGFSPGTLTFNYEQQARRAPLKKKKKL